MSIGLKIKELAGKKNITIADLAKRIGKTKQAVYEIVEKDDVNTSILRKLSEVFNVPIIYFFEDDVEMHVIADNHSQVVGIGNITRSEVESQAEVTLLKERVKYLEKLLAEKERLIKVLMERK